MKQKILANEIRTKILEADTRLEVELLLCCARTYIDFKRAKRIGNLLQENIDWVYLIETAIWHGVMPLLYQSLNTISPEAVPKYILEKLRNYFQSNALHNLFLAKELLALLNLFEKHNISAISFKGPVLAASAYNNLSLRQFCDLDILVDKRDVLRAKELLISQGYRLELELGWEYNFLREDSSVNVDLHQAVAPIHFPLPLDFERLWRRLGSVSLLGETVVNLLPEDMLLILCINIARDFWEQKAHLGQICDIAELLRVHQSMDWNQVIEQASTLGSKRILFLGLLLAKDILGTALPKEVLQKMQADSVVTSLAAQVQKRLFYEFSGSLRFFEGSLFYLKARERLQDKAKYIVTPNLEDRNILSLPASLSFLYYFLRPIRLVGKYGLSLLRHF